MKTHDSAARPENGIVALATNALKGGLLLLLLVHIGLLLYYVSVGYAVDFHSDSAVKNLLAQEMMETGSYFPPGWNYVNGDLWVVYGQLFIAPLLPWFANDFNLHAVSSVMTSILVLLSTWLASGMVVQSRWTRLTIIAVLTSGVSFILAENLFGQGSYGSVLYTSFLLIYFAWRWMLGVTRTGSIGWGLTFCLFNTLTFWSNPQRALAYDALPLAAGLLAWVVGTGNVALFESRGGNARGPTQQVRRAFVLSAMLVLSALLGIVLHSWTLSFVNNVAGAGAARWLSFAGLVSNISATVQGMLGIFGAIPPFDQPVMSLSGVYYAVRLVVTFLLLCLIPMAALRALKVGDPGARFFAGFTLSSLCLFVFLQMTTSVPDMTDPVTSSRYLIPALLMGMILVAARIEDSRLPWLRRGVAVSVMLVLLSSAITSANPLSRAWKERIVDPRISLIAELEKRGLHYGYATYWNASAISVLSGQRVRIRQIKLDGKKVQPYRALSSNRWYRPDAWKGKTFLMLTRAEIDQIRWDDLYRNTGRPREEFPLHGFRVFVFDGNIAGVLPGWADQPGNVPDLRIPITEATFHTAGRVENAAGGPQMVANTGESGYLHFGPYLELPAGRYTASFDLHAQGAGQLGVVDVVHDQSRKTLGTTGIDGSQTSAPIDVAFEVPAHVNDIELRVFTNGTAPLQLKGMRIRPVQAIACTASAPYCKR